MAKLTILYYHEVVVDGKGASYQKIEEKKFEEQMRFLNENGYTSMFFSELSKELPKKPVIISFDDGFKSVYEKAYPIMKKYGIKGNVYLPTAYIGEDEHFMTWEEVKTLTENGFEMQAHTHNHVDIRTLGIEEMKGQIELSNSIMEEKLGVKPRVISLPFGVYDKRSLKLLQKQAKYEYILGSFYGTINKFQLRRKKLLPKIGVSNKDNIKIFEKKLKGKFNWKGPLQRLRLKISSLRGQRVEKYDY